MVAGALLTTPFMLRYDLMLLAIPLAWLYAEATRTGFRPGEVKIGIAAFMLPWMPTEVARYGHLLVAPLVIMALFFVVARRALSPAEADASAMRSLGRRRPRPHPPEREKPPDAVQGLSNWQGLRDSNSRPAVLETAALTS